MINLEHLVEVKGKCKMGQKSSCSKSFAKGEVVGWERACTHLLEDVGCSFWEVRMLGSFPPACLLCVGNSQVELYKSTLTNHERHKMKNHGVLRDGLACKVPESVHACEKACHAFNPRIRKWRQADRSLGLLASLPSRTAMPQVPGRSPVSENKVAGEWGGRHHGWPLSPTHINIHPHACTLKEESIWRESFQDLLKCTRDSLTSCYTKVTMWAWNSST